MEYKLDKKEFLVLNLKQQLFKFLLFILDDPVFYKGLILLDL